MVLGVDRPDPLDPCLGKARTDQVVAGNSDRDLGDTILGVVDRQTAFHIREESCLVRQDLLAHQGNHLVARSAVGLERGGIDRKEEGKTAAVGNVEADVEADWVAGCRREWTAAVVVPTTDVSRARRRLILIR